MTTDTSTDIRRIPSRTITLRHELIQGEKDRLRIIEVDGQDRLVAFRRHRMAHWQIQTLPNTNGDFAVLASKIQTANLRSTAERIIDTQARHDAKGWL